MNCQLSRAFHPINAIPLLCKSKPLFGTPLLNDGELAPFVVVKREAEGGWSGCDRAVQAFQGDSPNVCLVPSSLQQMGQGEW